MSSPESDRIVWRKSTFSSAEGDCVEVAWRKSSFSGGNGDCVEVAWRKSSFSGGNGGCVEVTWPQQRVAVRDSKNTDGPSIEIGRDAWEVFVTQR